jgi:hypothetical protein
MTRDMLRRNRVPPVMFDGDPRLIAHRLETNHHMSKLFRREALLAPLNPSRTPGSHEVTLPTSKSSPLGKISTSRPSDPGSNLSRPGDLCVKRNKPLGCHHTPISRVNTSNARAGVAGTRIDTSMCEVICMSSRLKRCPQIFFLKVVGSHA